MDLKLSRRQALGSFGTVSLGALLAGCGENEQSGTTDTQAKLLDEGNSCKVTTEFTEGGLSPPGYSSSYSGSAASSAPLGP